MKRLFGRKNGFVFDSWERRHPSHDVFCRPFLLRALEILTEQYQFTRVLIGTDGQTPEGFFGEIINDPEKPIECPLNSSMNKYLEFLLSNRNIVPCNLSDDEYKQIEERLDPLLKQYNWTIKKR